MSDITRWFPQEEMLLNPEKTESVLVGTCLQRNKVDAEVVVLFSDTVKLLGVKLDSELSLDKHVDDVIRSCNYHTRALRNIRPLLSDDAAELMAYGIVSARLDYCNGLLYGTSTRNFDRLQVAQKALAKVVCQAPSKSSATELRRLLHWLPIRQRIEYKLALITYKTRLSGVPAYLAEFKTIVNRSDNCVHQADFFQAN
jgi:hypothetical protein